MRRERGRVVEITSAEELADRLGRGAQVLAGWRLVGLDLTGDPALADRLAGRRVAGMLVLGCRLPAEVAARLRAGGAQVFPGALDSPVDVARSGLYSPDELFDDPDYAASLDARVYAWSQSRHDRDVTLVEALHDHAIDEALRTWVAHRRVVGVMGGHAVRRHDPAFLDAARLGHRLADHATVATGGGPGAMEAANLGAWLRASDDLHEAVALLAGHPAFHPDTSAWAAAARTVLERWPDGRESLGVPTWFYGHEPPNLFASAIAKYFANSVREAVLLSVCDAGIVFLPGSAGTVQEVFQDACENFYADTSSVAPMVMVGRRAWTEDLPAWPLLLQLARDRAMQDHVHLVDSVDEAVEVIARG